MRPETEVPEDENIFFPFDLGKTKTSLCDKVRGQNLRILLLRAPSDGRGGGVRGGRHTGKHTLLRRCHTHTHAHTRTNTCWRAHASTHAGARTQPQGARPSYPTVKAAAGWLNGKPPEPEGWAAAAGALGFAPNVNTPDGLLFVKLKFVVLLPNWKTEATIVKAEKRH